MIVLSEPYFSSGRNPTADNFFMDITLSAHLLENNMMLIRTVRKSKSFLLQEFQTE